MNSFNQYTQIEPSRRHFERVDASPEDRTAERQYRARRALLAELVMQQAGAEMCGDYQRLATLKTRVTNLQRLVDDYEASIDRTIEKQRQQLLRDELRAREDRLKQAESDLRVAQRQYVELRQEVERWNPIFSFHTKGGFATRDCLPSRD